jgi:hypothetical protein
MCLECNYPGADILCVLIPLLGFNALYIMGKISGKFIKRRWLPSICYDTMIQEKTHESCVCSATIQVLIFCICQCLMPLIGTWPIFNTV